MKRVARASAMVGAVSIAACFSKPSEPHAGDHDGGIDAADARTDARSDSAVDAPPPNCTSVPVDTFDTNNSCGALGSAYGSAGAITRVGNQLQMAPTNVELGCESLTPFPFTAGTSLKVVQIATSGMPNTTYFRAKNAANSNEGIEVLFIFNPPSSAVYDVQCIGAAVTAIEMDYDGGAQLYWKFQAVESAIGTNVHAYYSANGTQWTDTGIACPWTSVAMVTVDVGVAYAPDPSGPPALFDDFNIKTCPP